MTDQHGNTVAEADKMAEEFNLYFSLVFTKETNTEGVVADDPICVHMSETIEDIKIMEDEV